MDVIISEDNKLYKSANKLKQKKYRDISGEYLIEGYRGILDTPDEYIKTILASEKFDCNRLNKNKIVYFSDKLMNKLSSADSAPGVIAIAYKKPLSDLISNTLS